MTGKVQRNMHTTNDSDNNLKGKYDKNKISNLEEKKIKSKNYT